MRPADTHKTEYHKLDPIDQKVLRWTLTHAPTSVPSWIEYTIAVYRNRSGIIINGKALLDEMRPEPDRR